MSWRAEAACLDVEPEVFIKDRPGADYSAARRICGRCPVVIECRRFALETGTKVGIFGAMTHDERKQWAKAEATNS